MVQICFIFPYTSQFSPVTLICYLRTKFCFHFYLDVSRVGQVFYLKKINFYFHFSFKRVGPVAQYCFIFLYGAILTIGLLANVAVLAAFVTSKVDFLSSFSFSLTNILQITQKLFVKQDAIIGHHKNYLKITNFSLF